MILFSLSYATSLSVHSGEESLIDDDVGDKSHHVNLVDGVSPAPAGTADEVAAAGPSESEKPRKPTTKKKKKKNNSGNNDASISSGASNNSSTNLEGSIPLPTPRLEDDEDEFESNTTYV